ncbi:LOW QUALITY PROTEIN: immunoglobulin superfamily member 10-like [Lethenteron reissneri]|uniref:LOW QUALITY PROTEIN: immunoglobulin superfamily member 10-like n=1 Tax=Lethenteron reissneri TaxID=7753 RepID=UPI002AB7AC6E|nr:LOW QUALITY PROTEIN: immunoglobulin superfamily member 10-like [Lethenteron reissneri]
MAGLTQRVSLSGATILHLHHHLVHHLLLLLLLLLLPFPLPGSGGGVASAQRAGRDCPRACTCYHREEVHCTFRYLNAVPAGLPRDALRINMGYNSLTALDEGSFADLAKLEILMLHGNEMRFLPDGVFGQLRALQVLKLSYNKLRSLRRPALRGLRSLERLHLDRNLLERLDPDAFVGLTSLRLLQLEGNQLRSLHADAFATAFVARGAVVSTLAHLSLADNRLRSLPPSLLTSMPALESLTLQGNPWACDCALRPLREWAAGNAADVLKCTAVEGGSRDGDSRCPRCASPARYKGRHLLSIPARRLACTAPSVAAPGTPRKPDDDDGTGELPLRHLLRARASWATLGLNLTAGPGRAAMLRYRVGAPRATTPVAVRRLDDGTVLVDGAFETRLACDSSLGDGRRQLLSAMGGEAAARVGGDAAGGGGPRQRELRLTRLPEVHGEASASLYTVVAERGEPSSDGAALVASVSTEADWLLQPTIGVSLSGGIGPPGAEDGLDLTLTTAMSGYRGAGDHGTSEWVLIRGGGNDGDGDARLNQAVVEGAPVQMLCGVDAAPGAPAALHWTLADGTRVREPYESTDNRVTAARGGQLLIKSAQVADSGVYACVASTRDDADAMEFRLEVLPAIAEGAAGKDLSVLVGGDLGLPCRALGSPDPSVVWVFPDGSVSVDLPSRGERSATVNGTLNIKGIGAGDGGLYRCVAMNRLGAKVLSVNVTVASPDANGGDASGGWRPSSQPNNENSYFPSGNDGLPRVDLYNATRNDSSLTRPPSAKQHGNSVAGEARVVTEKDEKQEEEDEEEEEDDEEGEESGHALKSGPHGRRPAGPAGPRRIDNVSVKERDPQRWAQVLEEVRRRHREWSRRGGHNDSLAVTAAAATPAGHDLAPSPGASAAGETETSAEGSAVSRGVTVGYSGGRDLEWASTFSGGLVELSDDHSAIVETVSSDERMTPAYEAAYTETYTLGTRAAVHTSMADTDYGVSETILSPFPTTSATTEKSDVALTRRTSAAGDRAGALPANADPEHSGWGPDNSFTRLPSRPQVQEHAREAQRSWHRISSTTTVPSALLPPSPPRSTYGRWHEKLQWASAVGTPAASLLPFLQPEALLPVTWGKFHTTDGDPTVRAAVSATADPELESQVQTPTGPAHGSSSTSSSEGSERPRSMTRRPSGVTDQREGATSTSRAARAQSRSATGSDTAAGSPPSHWQNTFTGPPVTEGYEAPLPWDGLQRPAVSDTRLVPKGAHSTKTRPLPTAPTTRNVKRAFPNRAAAAAMTAPTTVLQTDQAHDRQGEASAESAEGPPPKNQHNHGDEKTTTWREESGSDSSNAVRPHGDADEDSLRGAPVIVDKASTMIAIVADSDVAIHCPAIGNPPPTISWTKVATGATIRAGSRLGSRFEVLPNGTFLVRSGHLQDRGQYLCTAANDRGSDHYTVTLTVLAYRPRVRQPRFQNLTAHQGEPVELRCPAEGRPKPQVSWLLPDRSFLRTASLGEGRVTLAPDGTLHIRRVAASDRGSYKCIASNPAGTDTVGFQLDVISAPPEIAQQKTEDLPGIVGQSLVIHCSAGGFPTPSVRWLLSDGSVVRPSQFLKGKLFVFPNGTLHIARLATADSGSYECVATNAMGVDRRVVSLSVSSPLSPAKIARNKQRAAVDVRYGEVALLNCVSSGDPQPKVIWRLPSKIVIDTLYSPDNRVSVHENGSLSVGTVIEGDAGDYLCVARNSLGYDMQGVTMNVTLEAARIDKRAAGASGTDLVVSAGGTAWLDCVASGLPRPDVSWSLPDGTTADGDGEQKDGGRRAVLRNGTLLVRNVARGDEGVYTCVARNAAGGDEATVRLSVPPRARPPKIEGHARKAAAAVPLQVRGGDAARLSCDAAGEPKPSVAWVLPSTRAPLTSADGPRVQRDGSLIIERVGKADAGVYTCIARNALGEDSKAISLEVVLVKPVINGIQDRHVVTGDSAVKFSRKRINCRADGLPQPRVAWVMPGNVVLTTPYEGSRISVLENGTLEIKNVRRSDAGEFLCVARSEAGEATLRVKLVVTDTLEKPVLKNPKNEKIITKEGRAVTLNCSATGVPTPETTWLFPNGTLVTKWQKMENFRHGKDGALVILRPAQRDAGTYRCTAKNAVGFVEKAVTLEVGQKPVIALRHRGLVRSTSGEPLFLHCVVSGNPKPTVRWVLPNGASVDGASRASAAAGGRATLLANGTLALSAATPHDRGMYVCHAENTAGHASAAVPVIVVAYPPRITRGPPRTVLAQRGARLRLRCAAIGVPKADVAWELPSGAKLSTASAGAHAAGGGGGVYLHPAGTLYVQTSGYEQSGFYKCVASNALGSDVVSTYVRFY